MPTPKALIDLNLRDLGGIATQDGHVLRPGLVYRAGALSKLDPTTRAAVDGLGLRTIEGRWSPERQPDGSVDAVGFVMDVTARTESEHALRAVMERHRSLFENMLNGPGITD